MTRGLAAVLLLVLLTGCARHYTPEAVADPYGVFSGLWHGLVSPYAVATNLLSWLLGLMGLDVLRTIEIVGRPNTGFGYWAGFVFGLMSYGGAKVR
jgi:hypothetical protein